MEIDLPAAASEKWFIGGLSYHYQLSPNWAMGVGFLFGDSTECQLVCGGGVIEPAIYYKSYFVFNEGRTQRTF